uniref:Uncharacterized protein n=1 Tax=Strongyloides venezuelensis TaxID=75913 RepID=A0A0K0G5R0_STRVS
MEENISCLSNTGTENNPIEEEKIQRFSQFQSLRSFETTLPDFKTNNKMPLTILSFINGKNGPYRQLRIEGNTLKFIFG